MSGNLSVGAYFGPKETVLQCTSVLTVANQLVLRKTDETDLLQGIAEADGRIAINDHVLRACARSLGKVKDLLDGRVLERCGS